MGYITQATFTPSRKSLSLPPPQNKNKWVHLIIFESQPKIQLTQLSYTVTSFLNFQPFLKGFQSVYQYLEDLTKDLNNPGYLHRLLYQVKPFQITPLLNESSIQEFFNTENVDIIPLDVNQNLNLNNIIWKSNILIKCFMLFIENFLKL